MKLTQEHLVNLREQALSKRQAHIDAVHQANGAIELLNLLIAELNTSQTENSDAPNSDSND